MGILVESSNNFTLLSMKVFLTVAVACLAASARADISCDDCLSFGGNMQAYLMSADSVAEQTELLAALLCPNAADAAQCDEYVRTYWKDIAAAMYPKFLDPNDVCQQLGSCKIKGLMGEPTCDECKGAIERVAEVISSADQIAEIVSFLKSDWCPGTEDAAKCSAAIGELIPAAMPILGQVLVTRDNEYCCKLSDSGICC